MEDQRFLDIAVGELAQIGLNKHEDVIDGTLVRVPGAYPACFGTFKHVRNVL